MRMNIGGQEFNGDSIDWGAGRQFRSPLPRQDARYRMNYYLTYNESTWVEDEGDGSDEPYSWGGGTGLSVEIIGVYASEPENKWGWEVPDDIYGIEPAAVGQEVWLALVLYQDGSTFGYSCYWKCVGVFTSEAIANDASRRAWQPTGTGRIRPWDGYFAHLRDSWVERHVLQP